MKRYFLPIFFLLTVTLVTSCGEKSNENKDHNENPDSLKTEQALEAKTSWEMDGLKINIMEGSPDFASAKLEMLEPPVEAELGNKVDFQFDVIEYDLGTQTSDAEGKGIANSGKGQHIHLIINNGPYSALYEPNTVQELENGHYIVLAFLSRSYHESVKSPGAYVLQQFNVGPGVTEHTELSAPHLFYSRPKGSYAGDETKKLMLDFYLTNCDLSPDGFKVKASVNGNEFTITKWAPYVIEGLPMGENTIRLELIDKDGNTVSSPFNPVERTVMLEETKVEG